VLIFATPVLLAFELGLLMLFVIAICTTWVRELPALEEAAPERKWRRRVAALLLGLALILIDVAWRRSLLASDGSLSRLFVQMGATAFIYLVVLPKELLLNAGVSLAFVVLCMTAADGVARSMRGSGSVRVRMLVLGLASAALALIVAQLKIPQYDYVLGKVEAYEALTAIYKFVLLALMVSTFSITLSKGLSRSLEQSVRAISEIRRGNLDVALDDSGRDEVAAVARSVNQMVAQLREAEFLETINEDLRSRSQQLTETLQALRTAQADLVRSERMASVATLVKGIAHELNNPINYIAGNMAPLRRYCEFLTRVATDLSDGRARSAEEVRALTRLAERKDLAFVAEDLARLTSDIGEGARRVQLIITDLQSLTAAAQRGIERVELHRIVRQTVSLLEARVPSAVQLDTVLNPVSPLPARAGQLEQVLVNLTDNALRAVSDRGKVRIFVGEAEGQAIVRVTDDGPGMTAEVKAQAFEPFFTTRPAGEGSGLGLAIVASIIRGHRGTVALTSEPGHGTEVELRLPIRAGLIAEAELEDDGSSSPPA
jgi:signal transduction histidine kinase